MTLGEEDKKKQEAWNRNSRDNNDIQDLPINTEPWNNDNELHSIR